MKKLVNLYFVAIFLSVVGFILSGESKCFGDLTFHSTETAPKSEVSEKNQVDREIFPSPNGLEFFVNRSAALRIAEKDISAIIIREAPTGPFFEKSIKEAEKRGGHKYPKRANYEVVFRLKSSEAKKMRDFAQRNTGKTFAIRLRTLTISIPTFLGAFADGDEFALVGVSEDHIERIKKIAPMSFKDQRSRTGQ